MSSKISLGAIDSNVAAFFVCDLQEKFRPAMLCFSEIIENSKKLLAVSKILEIPTVATEQYPKGLGNTVAELDVGHAIRVIPKTKFSMVVPDTTSLLDSELKHVKVVILFGVEAHVCVEQTAIDLLSRGLTVHVVADASTSRSQEDRLLAFKRLRQIGCFVTTSETVIFKLLGDKDHPSFNDIRGLVKNPSANTGLASKM